MGNSTTLPYDVLDSIEYNNNNFWLLNNGSKKDVKQNVSIFKFSKKEKPDRILLAQKNVQKMRTIRHPYILTYVDALEEEESTVLVTEPCTPLEVWVKKIAHDPSIPKQNLFSELTWGFRCILKAIDFLHANCSLIHGNLGMHSIFVTPNGDWKLGSFELACNVTNNDDITHFINHHLILDKSYIAPERLTLTSFDSVKIEEVLKAKVPPFYLDMYSFGQCVSKTFQLADEELKGSLEKYITLTIHNDMKKRPKAKKLLETSIFNSDYIKILENIQEFSLKNPKEILEAIGQLDPLIPQMAIAICNHKLLPSVCKVLQISTNDFQNRDAREGARQSIVTCVELVSKLASHKKIEESVFQQDCVNIFVQLWSMTDRTVRTALLTTLKNLADLFPPAVVNKSLFDNMLAGFSDSNAKLRESTLMALIYVVDKLDETQLQDRLVRCICNLQNDPEASIRTNAAIFLGKIANKLKEAVRNRVLCNAFSKSMKDNFLHCRMAGMKTALACIKLLEVSQIATKIIPSASVLLLDKSTDVRTLALNLSDSCLQRMKEYNQFLLDAEREAKEASLNRNKEGASAASSSGILGTPVSETLLNMHSWTSWLSKTSENNASNTNMSQEMNKDLMDDLASPKVTQTVESTNHHQNAGDDFMSPLKGNKSNKPSKGWEDDLDSALDFGHDDDSSNRNTNVNHGRAPKEIDEYGFNDDFDVDDDGNDSYGDRKNSSFSSSPAPSNSSFKSSKVGGLSTSSAMQKEKSLDSLKSATITTSKAPKPAKVAVKKLEFNKEEDWEDF